MAIIEHEGALTYSDANGNENVIYPVTKASLVGGLGEAFTELMKNIYPIGSIFMSVDSESPETRFGGTWERIMDTFLLAAGETYAAGTSGGEASHLLTEDELPAHKHSANSIGISSSGYSSSGYSAMRSDNHSQLGDFRTQVSDAGGNMPHNNMPPYLAVYVWKRIA